MNWRSYITLSTQMIQVFISGYFDRRYDLLNHFDVRARCIPPLKHYLE
ncbi:MAG TPA: hypothetical protein PKC30_08405 [Saprospiraceae bacterium]|nr:hypothetical protein [Saprospiraceae bacterium]